MISLQFNQVNTAGFCSKQEVKNLEREINNHRKSIYQKTGRGSDFLGWVDLPSSFDPGLLAKIIQTAKKIREKSEVVVVCGIGGSYLGARAVIDALANPFIALFEGASAIAPAVVYAGHNLDENYHANLLKLLDKKEYSVIVISKSGTTTEPAVAFRLLKEHAEKKYGVGNSTGRIVAITDKARGALKVLATEMGYQTFDIPDDVGGRFSVLTPVGLLPIAVAGIEIDNMMQGAKNMENYLMNENSIMSNPAALYAATRNILYRKGKTIEILASYTPALSSMVEWWKQLYGESEGKEKKGIFPAGVGFTTDLHSMGQYIQDGNRFLFETVIKVENSNSECKTPLFEADLDGLNFLAGKRLDYINQMATKGTMLAHVDGGVPNLEITIPNLDAKSLGELIYFFEMGCAISGYTLGVNPFDQPGVEEYKRNMFALLKKPGFEVETQKLMNRL